MTVIGKTQEWSKVIQKQADRKQTQAAIKKRKRTTLMRESTFMRAHLQIYSGKEEL
jgi:hypothetical protein